MIWQAVTDADLARCFPLMRELRPHVAGEAAFVAQVRRQMEEGYRLTGLETAGELAALAGWRLSENLAWGRFLYVDDLVTLPALRSQGHGHALMEWLLAEARRAGCAQFHLDSGVQRFAAHRFYLGHRLDITAHHFGRNLG